MAETDGGAALAGKAQAGDREAFGALYDATAGRTYAYLYYRVLDRDSAEDLCATVYLKALEGLRGYRPELGSFQAWLYGIGARVLADHFRGRAKEARREQPADLWDIPDESAHEVEAENRDLYERLKPHLGSLSAEQREILFLRTWDELSYKEIGLVLGKSEAACKMAYSRALGILREAMPLSFLIAFLAARPPIA